MKILTYIIVVISIVLILLLLLVKISVEYKADLIITAYVYDNHTSQPIPGCKMDVFSNLKLVGSKLSNDKGQIHEEICNYRWGRDIAILNSTFVYRKSYIELKFIFEKEGYENRILYKKCNLKSDGDLSNDILFDLGKVIIKAKG